MMLQALLVSKDDQTAETLTQVLAQRGIAVIRSSVADVAVSRLNEERFDQVVVDFEDPETASLVLESCRRLAGPDRSMPVTVALLMDAQQIRTIVGNGAHFVLTKPVDPAQALATLQAAAAILKRERRQSMRVAVQAPVSIQLEQGDSLEAILLDLSTGGMDVLAARPLASSSQVHVSFALPDSTIQIDAKAEVVWGAESGQAGLCFMEMDPTKSEQLGEWLKARSHEDSTEADDHGAPCKLTDLSLGGCYVETESPLPQSSAVDLCLKVADMEIHTEGVVRVMHPSYGMGIEFPAGTEEQRKSVENLIGCLANHPGAEPHLEIQPRALVASAADLDHGDTPGSDVEDPLLELLRSGSNLEQEQFLAELMRQRTTAEVAQ